jgi:hypothetical protein
MELLKCLVHMHLTLHWMRCTVTTRPSTYKAGSNGVGTGHPSAATNQGVVSTAPGSRRGGLRGLDHYLPLGVGDTALVGAGRVSTARSVPTGTRAGGL